MHSNAVDPDLLNLIYRYMDIRELQDFCLAGGTSIALRTGYRKSIDIDLFTKSSFNSFVLRDRLIEYFPEAVIRSVSKGTIFLVVNSIKTDILQHIYPEVSQPEQINGIRLESLKDVSAMKVLALSNRGSKKDFSDLLFLHEYGIPLKESVTNYIQKYGIGGLHSAVISLTYFADAEMEPDPIYLNGWTWEYVKTRMAEISLEVQRWYHHQLFRDEQ